MATHSLISNITVGSNKAQTIVFNNIPQTYRDLKVIASVRNDTANGATLTYTLNTDTTSDYYISEYMQQPDFYPTGNYVGVYPYGVSIRGAGIPGSSGTPTPTSATGTFQSFYMYIPQYVDAGAKSIIYKTFGFNNQMNIGCTRWMNNGPITSITFSIHYNATYSFAQYTSFSLYGISNK